MARWFQPVVIRCAHCGGVMSAEGWVASYGGKDYHPACVGFPREVVKVAEERAGRRGKPAGPKGRLHRYGQAGGKA